MAQRARSGGKLKIAAAGDTHVGGRPFNEDAVLLRPDLDLYLAADGAGGHQAGNVASALALSAIAQYFEHSKDEVAKMPTFDVLGLPWAARRLSAAIHCAHREVLKAQKASEHHRGMATTVVAAVPCVDERVLHLAHVGDSRCYRLRQGRLEQLTSDHTLITDVLELSPEIDGKLAAELPRNVTTRALGMPPRLRVSVRSIELLLGDRFLLCTDGLTRVLDDDGIWEVMCLSHKPERQVRLLIDLAITGAPTDNLAVVILACDGPKGAAAQEERAAMRPPRLRGRPKPKTASSPKPAAAPKAGATPKSPATARAAAVVRGGAAAKATSWRPPATNRVPAKRRSEAQLNDSTPEIEVITLDDEPPPSSESVPEIHAVATEELSEDLLRTLRGVVTPTPSTTRVPMTTMPYIDVGVCEKCNELVERSAHWCPHCGCERPS
jgi:PPM family protein phosphatase